MNCYVPSMCTAPLLHKTGLCVLFSEEETRAQRSHFKPNAEERHVRSVLTQSSYLGRRWRPQTFRSSPMLAS